MKEENELATQIIDLGAKRKGELNETILAAFGEWIKTIMKWTFGENVFFPSKVRGTQSEVNSFMSALKNERRYMNAYKSHGLGDKRTYDSKYKLDAAVKKFEQTTGLKWPFK
mgnify:FL=1|tara:strand:+ start:4574 stop:4909 length:336 start_codon:yes stop_codon:yes gene_type:complete